MKASFENATEPGRESRAVPSPRRTNRPENCFANTTTHDGCGTLGPLRAAISYYGITFGLCLLLVALTPVLGAQALNLAMLTPLVAVLVQLLVLSRDGYSRAGWLGLGVHRAGWRGWGLAMGVPIGVLGAAYGLFWSSGLGSIARAAGGQDTSLYLLDVVLSWVIVTLVGGLGEEIGWRGYLLPRLLGLGAGRAVLLTGFLHGLFHIPAIVWTPYYHGDSNPWIVIPLFLATLSAAGVCYGYLRLTTGSVWPAAVAHSTFNVLNERLRQLTEPSAALEYWAAESGVFTLLALSAVAVWLLRRLPRS